MITLAPEYLVERADSLPKLPDTTLRLINVVNNPDSSLDEIVEIIRYDQTVTTELLRLCNSAFFALSRKISSIDDAVRYVGTAKLMQLVMAAHTQALLSPEQAGYGLRPGALWCHSIGVAVGCQLMAQRAGMKDRGTLFTVGLLHDMGKIVLNENISVTYSGIVRMVNDMGISFLEAEQRMLGVTHPEVGEMVAQRWKLPDPIPQCIRYHHEPDALPEPDPMVDIVHLADAACRVMGIGGGDDSPMYRVVPAVLERTGLKETDIEQVGAEVVVEVKSIQELFGIQ